MFLLLGLSSKIRPAGHLPVCSCPACAEQVSLHLSHSYTTPTVFFIPTVKLGSRWLATCPLCASVMELNSGAAARLRRDPAAGAAPEDLAILQNNNRPGGVHCPACGAEQPAGHRFCSACGCGLHG